MTEFRKYPSIPRYRKDIQITEKIDGTNAAVVISSDPDDVLNAPEEDIIENEGGTRTAVQAQSRNRMITPDGDNHGFARWVRENQVALYVALGEGYHYGEWWGLGINRGYGQKQVKGSKNPAEGKHFTLFNPDRYRDLDSSGIANLNTVPVLYEGDAVIDGVDMVEVTMRWLKVEGSRAPGAEGYDNPEGVVVFHTAARQLYKVTYEYDEGKWTAER